jgi:hypothetical protein
LLLAVAASGCGATPPTPGPAGPSPGGATIDPPPSVRPTTPPTAVPSSIAPVSPPAAVIRDDSLLAILPPEVDGTPVVAEEESFAEAAADPAFAANVARAAFAIVAAPDDLASGVVAELVPGVLDDDFFRDWRETYDEGACAQSGGVVASAETELDGRTVFITTCGGGLRVYHAALEERGVVVSLFSLGERRFGEQLISDLGP